MITFHQPVSELIRRRFSCRTYQSRLLELDQQRLLADFSRENSIGPLGLPARFELVAATEEDQNALRGLGTYGFIKNAPAFLVGAAKDGGKSLEDFGYMMEKIILFATDLGLGTCWLGGSFNRSRFAQRIALRENEIIPAITSLGYIAQKPGRVDAFIRKQAAGDHRRPWSWMFFDQDFAVPLTEQTAGNFAGPLEMVRLGPSASNLQPWRVIKDGSAWHFYLHRKPGYRNSRSSRFLQTADLQRVDLGIAMCHFEMTARELNISGHWEITDPAIPLPNTGVEYTASWISGMGGKRKRDG